MPNICLNCAKVIVPTPGPTHLNPPLCTNGICDKPRLAAELKKAFAHLDDAFQKIGVKWGFLEIDAHLLSAKIVIEYDPPKILAISFNRPAPNQLAVATLSKPMRNHFKNLGITLPSNGNIDFDQFKKKAKENHEELSKQSVDRMAQRRLEKAWKIIDSFSPLTTSAAECILQFAKFINLSRIPRVNPKEDLKARLISDVSPNELAAKEIALSRGVPGAFSYSSVPQEKKWLNPLSEDVSRLTVVVSSVTKSVHEILANRTSKLSLDELAKSYADGDTGVVDQLSIRLLNDAESFLKNRPNFASHVSPAELADHARVKIIERKWDPTKGKIQAWCQWVWKYYCISKLRKKIPDLLDPVTAQSLTQSRSKFPSGLLSLGLFGTPFTCPPMKWLMRVARKGNFATEKVSTEQLQFIRYRLSSDFNGEAWQNNPELQTAFESFFQQYEVSLKDNWVAYKDDTAAVKCELIGLVANVLLRFNAEDRNDTTKLMSKTFEEAMRHLEQKPSTLGVAETALLTLRFAYGIPVMGHRQTSSDALPTVAGINELLGRDVLKTLVVLLSLVIKTSDLLYRKLLQSISVFGDRELRLLYANFGKNLSPRKIAKLPELKDYLIELIADRVKNNNDPKQLSAHEIYSESPPSSAVCDLITQKVKAIKNSFLSQFKSTLSGQVISIQELLGPLPAVEQTFVKSHANFRQEVNEPQPPQLSELVVDERYEEFVLERIKVSLVNISIAEKAMIDKGLALGTIDSHAAHFQTHELLYSAATRTIQSKTDVQACVESLMKSLLGEQTDVDITNATKKPLTTGQQKILTKFCQTNSLDEIIEQAASRVDLIGLLAGNDDCINRLRNLHLCQDSLALVVKFVERRCNQILSESANRFIESSMKRLHS